MILSIPNDKVWVGSLLVEQQAVTKLTTVNSNDFNSGFGGIHSRERGAPDSMLIMLFLVRKCFWVNIIESLLKGLREVFRLLIDGC